MWGVEGPGALNVYGLGVQGRTGLRLTFPGSGLGCRVQVRLRFRPSRS